MNLNENCLPTKNPSTSSAHPKEPASFISSVVSSAVPLDLASKSDTSQVPISSALPKSAVIPVKLRYANPKVDSKANVTSVRQKIHKGINPAIPIQSVHRPSTDPRSITRPPFIVEQLIRMPEHQPRFSSANSGQAIRVTLPLQKVVADQKLSSSGMPAVSNQHTMASIMRSGTAQNPIVQSISQSQLMSNNVAPAQYTSHVPRGPAAIASITVQKSAAVASPIVRPAFSVTQFPASKVNVITTTAVHPNASLVAKSASSELHVKESMQISASKPVARHQIPLTIPSTMLVAPTRNLATNIPISAEKSRITDSSVSFTESGAKEKVIASSQISNYSAPQHIMPIDDKSIKGVTISVTAASTLEAPIKASMSSGNQMGATISVTSTLPQSVSSHVPTSQFSLGSKLPQAQNLVTSHPGIQQRNVSSTQQQSQRNSQIVQTVAPISLQCQSVNKNAMAKNIIITSAPANVTAVLSRSATDLVTSTPASVPVAKVYPQQVSGQIRNPTADVSIRNTVLPQHGFGPIRLPAGITAVPSNAPVTSSIAHSVSSNHISTNDRQAVAVDISQGYSYNVPTTQAAYYYSHQRLDITTNSQTVPSNSITSSVTRQPSTIRPGVTLSQPVRFGQMVVTVNPNRPHQMSIHSANSTENVISITKSVTPSTPALTTVYAIATTMASHISNANGANSQSAVSTATTSAPNASTSHPPLSSPRPSILRKRHSEMSTSAVRKNLMTNSLNSDQEAVSKQIGLLKSPMKTSEVGHDRNILEKINVRQETSETVDPDMLNGNSNGSAGTPVYEASPRKKPRKQQLLANELKEVNSSDNEEKEVSPEKVEHKSKTKAAAKEDTSKWDSVRKQQMVLMNTYKHSWKSRQNHYLKHTDIKCKEEKKLTVNDLANQKYINQKVNGWKLYHLSVQMDDLADLESNTHTKLSRVLKLLEKVQANKSNEYDKEFHKTNELLKGNLQRCRLIKDQMLESKTQVFKVFEHKPHVLDIINKYVSKRSVKKRERL